MREHSRELEESSLRPKAARIEEESPANSGTAAAAGRTGVLSGSDLLGLQRSAGNTAVSSLVDEDPSPVHSVISSPGRPLEAPVRADLEARLGHDFGDVRVHDDGAAHASATAVDARAYTVGSHVVFQRDAYDPSSTEGKRTLAHELTHVVQQRSGPVDGTQVPGGISVSNPSDRFEQEAAMTAEAALTAPAPDRPGRTAALPRSADEPSLGLQRQEREAAEETAERIVQREEMPEEIEEDPW